MSMPPEIAQALMKGGNGGASQSPDASGAPPPPTGMDAGPDPGAAPMMAPQKPSGDIQKGKLQAVIALKMLEQALVAFGAHTPEGSAVLKAMTPLTKIFGKDAATSGDLMNSEKKAIAGTIPPTSGGPPMPGAPPPPGVGAPPMSQPALG